MFQVSAFSVYLFYFCPLDTIRYTPMTKSIIPIIISFLLQYLLGIYPIIYDVFIVKKRTLTVFQVSALVLGFILYFTIHLQTATVNKITDAAIIAIKI